METRNCKRRRDTIDVVSPASISDINDYEIELTTKSAKEFDYIIKKIKSVRRMNLDELRLVGIIRKKIKHRDSSRVLRKGKKEYITGLEKRVEVLEKQNTDYEEEIRSLHEQLEIINQLSKSTVEDDYDDFIDVETPSDGESFECAHDAGDLPLHFEYEYNEYNMYVFDYDTYSSQKLIY